MRPLLYSENEAKTRGVGWHRTGHHISYHRNVIHLQSGVLPRDMVLFMLEWQMVGIWKSLQKDNYQKFLCALLRLESRSNVAQSVSVLKWILYGSASDWEFSFSLSQRTLPACKLAVFQTNQNNNTRKSSYVNARGTLPAMQQVLTMLLCLMMGGYPIQSWWGYPSSHGGGYPIQSWLGVPHPVNKRYPIQTWLGGYPGYPHPDLGWGTPCPDLGWGTPHPDLARGYPHPDLGWVPPIQTWDGVPPCPDLRWGTPIQTWHGVPPQGVDWQTNWKQYLPSSFRCGQ